MHGVFVLGRIAHRVGEYVYIELLGRIYKLLQIKIWNIY